LSSVQAFFQGLQFLLGKNSLRRCSLRFPSFPLRFVPFSRMRPPFLAPWSPSVCLILTRGMTSEISGLFYSNRSRIVPVDPLLNRGCKPGPLSASFKSSQRVAASPFQLVALMIPAAGAIVPPFFRALDWPRFFSVVVVGSFLLPPFGSRPSSSFFFRIRLLKTEGSSPGICDEPLPSDYFPECPPSFPFLCPKFFVLSAYER